MSQIYDARTGTYIRGGSSSADPGGQSVYHIDDWQNASSYKDPSNPRSVSYPAAVDPVSATQAPLAESVAQGIAPTYQNNYSALVDGFLGAFNSNNSMLHDLISSQMRLSERNSALSQEMANEANAFSSNEAALARAWSGEQAKVNRDWQTAMSNTAHQREVADLIASGLNPILSANNGASTGNSGIPGASMAQSHQGQVDTTSAYGMATNLMQSMISSAVQMKSLDVQQAMQEKNLVLQREQMDSDILRTKISAKAQTDAAGTSAYGNITASQNAKDASEYRANIDKEIAELRSETDKEIAGLNNQTKLDTSVMGTIGYYIKHPQEAGSVVSNIVKNLDLNKDYDPDSTYFDKNGNPVSEDYPAIRRYLQEHKS